MILTEIAKRHLYKTVLVWVRDEENDRLIEMYGKLAGVDPLNRQIELATKGMVIDRSKPYDGPALSTSNLRVIQLSYDNVFLLAAFTGAIVYTEDDDEDGGQEVGEAAGKDRERWGADGAAAEC